MIAAGNPVLFMLTVIFVAAVGLFGLFGMFAKSPNVERDYLVGGLTVLTSLLSIGMLMELPQTSQTAATLTSIAAISPLGYFMGRFIDYYLGPQASDVSEIQNQTLGADLAE